MVLNQYGAIMIGTWWYWVSMYSYRITEPSVYLNLVQFAWKDLFPSQRWKTRTWLDIQSNEQEIDCEEPSWRWEVALCQKLSWKVDNLFCNHCNWPATRWLHHFWPKVKVISWQTSLCLRVIRLEWEHFYQLDSRETKLWKSDNHTSLPLLCDQNRAVNVRRNSLPLHSLSNCLHSSAKLSFLRNETVLIFLVTVSPPKDFW